MWHIRWTEEGEQGERYEKMLMIEEGDLAKAFGEWSVQAGKSGAIKEVTFEEMRVSHTNA